MTKIEFLNKLKINLAVLSEDEQDRIIEYYSEIISDKIDEGKTEQEAVAELGSPEQVSQSVLEDYTENETKTNTKPRKPHSAGAITGFSILIPFVIIMLAVLGVLAVAFTVASAAFIIGGIAYFISSFVIFPQGFAAGLFQTGAGFFMTALGVFAMFGSGAFGNLYLGIIKRIFKKYVSVYGGGENAKV